MVTFLEIYNLIQILESIFWILNDSLLRKNRISNSHNRFLIPAMKRSIAIALFLAVTLSAAAPQSKVPFVVKSPAAAPPLAATPALSASAITDALTKAADKDNP